jgi:hypothetical protein
MDKIYTENGKEYKEVRNGNLLTALLKNHGYSISKSSKTRVRGLQQTTSGISTSSLSTRPNVYLIDFTSDLKSAVEEVKELLIENGFNVISTNLYTIEVKGYTISASQLDRMYDMHRRAFNKKRR